MASRDSDLADGSGEFLASSQRLCDSLPRRGVINGRSRGWKIVPLLLRQPDRERDNDDAQRLPALQVNPYKTPIIINLHPIGRTVCDIGKDDVHIIGFRIVLPIGNLKVSHDSVYDTVRQR